MNNSKQHSEFLEEVMLKVMEAFPGRIRLFKRDVGLFRYLKSNGKIKIGINGEPDIQGFIKPTGRAIMIEIKTGKGKLSDDQQKFRKIAEDFGVLYIVGRDVEEILTTIGNYLNSIDEATRL